MKTAGKIGLGVLGLLLLLIAIVAVRTVTYKPFSAGDVRLAARVPIDNAKAAR